jgi:outer membrane protein TolC
MKFNVKSKFILVIALFANLLALEPLGLKKAEELALEQNLSYLQTKLQVELARVKKDHDQLNNWPQLQFLSDYSRVGPSFSPNDYNTASRNQYQDQLRTQIALRWQIFDSFANIAQWKKSNYVVQSEEENLKRTKKNLLSTVNATYFQALKDQLLLDQFKLQMNISKDRYLKTEQKHQTGSYSLLDLYQAKLNYSADSLAFINQQMNFKKSMHHLNWILDIDIDSSFDLDRLAFKEMAKDIQEPNLELHPHVLAAKNRKNALIQEKKWQERQFFPKINFYANYNFFNQWNDPNSLQNPDQNHRGMVFGLQLNVPIFDRSLITKNKSLEIDNRRAQLEITSIRNDMQLQWSNLNSEYEKIIKAFQLEQENFELSVAFYDLAVSQYQLGSVSLFDLRQIEEKKIIAEKKWIEIQIDLAIMARTIYYIFSY